ncbi:MAG: hypothetical protein PHN75_03115 [Syntrophales bacterium]|nr:hypothetical protein [Syntrophales bacterium]
MKNFIENLKKFKDYRYVVKSDITGRPFYGEVVIVFTEGKIDRTNNYDVGEIARVKESIKI